MISNKEKFLKLINELSNERISEVIHFLESAHESAMEDATNAEGRVSFYTKLLESCETGETITFQHPLSGTPFTFDPAGEDKESFSALLEEANIDLIDAKQRLNILSLFKAIFRK